jgi:nucleolar pre-ribosomal-associated protein 2
LRWILEKLKDSADNGIQARANAKAWRLVDWMVKFLPRSRAAVQLREADFLSILERALQENFDRDDALIPAPVEQRMMEEESPEPKRNTEEDMKPSRKRKRPSAGAQTPSKRIALPSLCLKTLFGAIFDVVNSIADRAGLLGRSDAAQREHMKMVLRTESSQAARILKGWVTAVNALLTMATVAESLLPAHLELTVALKIWELRAVEAGDPSGASSDPFCAECLIPILILYNRIHEVTKGLLLEQGSTKRLQRTSEELEALLAGHIFAPARIAFFTKAVQSDGASESEPARTEQLSSNLTPLRAKILQAAEIQDAGTELVPTYFVPLFRSIPQLLDIAVRMSPSRSPRNWITERPWIQAVFVVLAECVGCSLEPPKFSVPLFSIKAIGECLRVLRLNDVNIDSDILLQLFWFHSGVEYPLNSKAVVHWPLIAALIKLDPTTFVSNSSSASDKLTERPTDIAKILFDQISLANQNNQLPGTDDEMEIDRESLLGNSSSIFKNDMILESVIFPLMSAFARNRDLLGFIHRWDDQLCENAPINRGVFEEINALVWEDRSLCLELERLLEKSLTAQQIIGLFQLHADRLDAVQRSKRDMSGDSESDSVSIKKAYSSTVLLRSLLSSLNSDEILTSLQPQLISLFASFTAIVRDKRSRSLTDQESSWITLCKLVVVLWPQHIHTSLDTQQQFLGPLIEQAQKDISTAKKKRDERPITSRTKAAALLFLLTTSDHLRTVPGWDDILKEILRKALKCLSPSRLEATELQAMMEVFCTDFGHLLDYLEANTRKDSLQKLVEKLAQLGLTTARDMVECVSQHIFTSSSAPLREAYADALLEAVDEAADDESILGTVKYALLQMRPLSLPRDRRENILNKITESLVSKSKDVELLLSVMISLQEVPNATADISSHGKAFFKLAQSFHDHGCESDTVLRLFRELILRTLGHMLPNKDQAQNRNYLDAYQKKLSSLLKQPARCFPGRFAIIRASWLAQKSEELISWDVYISFLTDCFSTHSISEETTLAAFDDIPSKFLEAYQDKLQAARDVLRTHLDVAADFSSRDAGEDSSASAVPGETQVLRHALLAKFKLYPDVTCLVQLSEHILGSVNLRQQDTVMESTRRAFTSLSLTEQLALVPQLSQRTSKEGGGTSYRLLHGLASALHNKAEVDPVLREQQLAILPTVCSRLDEGLDGRSFCALLDTVGAIIRDKPAFTSQHSIECVLTVLVKLSSRNGPHLACSDAEAIYARITETTRLVLLLHRSRLGGRFHLLLPLLQNLLLCLFVPHGSRQNLLPPWLRARSSAAVTYLTANNAAQYSRLLSTLCSPTQSSVSKAHQSRGSTSNSKSSLNDPVKAAREYVSHYIYPLLASFCRFQLNGRLESAVRGKLVPGMWELVSTAELDKDALQAMYAGLDRSSREIWKGLWEEWKSHSKRGVGI